MKTQLGAALFGAFLCVSGSNVNANNGIQYNYGEFRYIVDSELDFDDTDGDGFAFAGSYRVDELFYVIADYESIDYDDDIDTDLLQVGGGVIFPYRKVDMIAELALVDFDIDGRSTRDSEVGFRATGGARGYVIPQLELRGTLNYMSLDEDDSYVTVGADYFINRSFSVNVAKDIAADIDRFSVGVRYYFGE